MHIQVKKVAKVCIRNSILIFYQTNRIDMQRTLYITTDQSSVIETETDSVHHRINNLNWNWMIANGIRKSLACCCFLSTFFLKRRSKNVSFEMHMKWLMRKINKTVKNFDEQFYNIGCWFTDPFIVCMKLHCKTETIIWVLESIDNNERYRFIDKIFITKSISFTKTFTQMIK